MYHFRPALFSSVPCVSKISGLFVVAHINPQEFLTLHLGPTVRFCYYYSRGGERRQSPENRRDWTEKTGPKKVSGNLFSRWNYSQREHSARPERLRERAQNRKVVLGWTEVEVLVYLYSWNIRSCLSYVPWRIPGTYVYVGTWYLVPTQDKHQSVKGDMQWRGGRREEMPNAAPTSRGGGVRGCVCVFLHIKPLFLPASTSSTPLCVDSSVLERWKLLRSQNHDTEIIIHRKMQPGEWTAQSMNAMFSVGRVGTTQHNECHVHRFEYERHNINTTRAIQLKWGEKAKDHFVLSLWTGIIPGEHLYKLLSVVSSTIIFYYY